MKVKLTVLLAFLPSVVYASESFNGLRVGVGYSSTSILDDSEFYDYGDGLKLELGYDFNRIVGINLSYQESDYSETTYFETLKVDGTTVKVDADVGFAFDFQGWSLKPYGAAGVAFGQEDVEFGNFTDSASETALLLGAGVRFIADFGLYADLRQDFIFYEYSDLSQTSISVGYKF